MPALALPAFWGAVSAGTAAGAGIYAANKTSNAATDAATQETAAQKYAADLQAKGAADALAFTKSQGENAFQNNEAARQGNYGMYAAAQRRLGSVGQLIGAGPREIPAYVPGVDPNFTGASATPATPPSAAGGANGPAANLADPNAWLSLVSDTPKLTQWVQGQGVTDPKLVSYYVGKIKGQPGQNANEQADGARFWGDLIRNPTPARPSAPAPVGSAASYLQATPTPYAPVTMAQGLRPVASYLNG